MLEKRLQNISYQNTNKYDNLLVLTSYFLGEKEISKVGQGKCQGNLRHYLLLKQKENRPLSLLSLLQTKPKFSFPFTLGTPSEPQKKQTPLSLFLLVFLKHPIPLLPSRPLLANPFLFFLHEFYSQLCERPHVGAAGEGMVDDGRGAWQQGWLTAGWWGAEHA